MFINVLGQYVSILIESSSGCSKKKRSLLRNSKAGSIFLEGPDDGSIRIETCCPSTIINIIKVCCVWLTHHFIFIVVFWHYHNWNCTWRESYASQNTQNFTQSIFGISCKFAADIFKCKLHLFHCNYCHTGKSPLKLHLYSIKSR